MRTRLILLLLLSILFVGIIPVYGQNTLDIRNAMTDEQFRLMGLNKLTDEELQRLNLFINIIALAAMRQGLEGDSTSSATGSDSSTTGVIESRISGEFTGWDGETIFRLMNGQTWQQSSYAYTYHYAYMPKVTIYRVGAQYKMNVEGVSSSIYVKRIR